MKASTVLSNINQMIRRLNAVSSSVTDEAKDEILSELEVLDWLKSLFLSSMERVAIIIGDSKFMSPVISEISSISRHQATQSSDGQYRSTSSVGESSSLIIVSPTDKIFTRFTDEYECEHIDEGPDGLPDYAICNKMCVATENGSKAIMLNLSVRKEYLSISDLETWAFDHLV